MVYYASAYNKPIALYIYNTTYGTPIKMLMKTPIYGINPIIPMTNTKANAII